MPFAYILYSAWRWLLDPGLSLAILLTIAVLIPRIGRFAIRFFTRRVDLDEQDSKTRLALVGTAVYVAQLVAYFFLIVAALNELGIPLAGAAIPATVISAALGLGAQSIIADFLAGFFILSEKQFGVGDWVAFKGQGVDVEGDVIQITMRATKVRTLQGETVTIPNGAARVCINHSNIWARAVVIIPVLLLSSSSIHEAISRSEQATRRALARPDIVHDVTGDLDVHPAVNITQPTTVGMPWMVDMRFIVQVNPARQWAVERAIRTAILEEFWEEYGSATTTSGAVRNHLEREAPVVVERAFKRDPLIDVPLSDTTITMEAQKDVTEPSRTDISLEHPADAPIDEQEMQEPEKVFRTITYPSRFARMVSFRGRVRPSTTGLFALLLALFIAKGFTVETSEEFKTSGSWLAPTANTTTTSTPAATPTMVPTEETTVMDSSSVVESATTTPTTTQTQQQTQASTSVATQHPETSISAPVQEQPTSLEPSTPQEEQPAPQTSAVQPEQ